MTNASSDRREPARRLGLVLSSIAVVLIVPGCGDGAGEPVDAGRDGGKAPSAGGALEVECGNSLFDFDDLADAPPVSSLPDGPASAIDDAGAPAFDRSHAWKVVHRSKHRVDLVRELEEPFDNGRGDVRTHESRTLEEIDGAGNVPDGTWLLTSAGPCAPRRITDDDLGPADLTLAEVPSPAATSVELLVHERACVSGAAATGRVELIELRETAEEVRVHIEVRPLGGNQTCPGNPPTPFAVDLSEPLGEREIVDTSVLPPRPISS